jgi:single-stranded DNA-binding protein
MSPQSNGDVRNHRHNFINITLQVGQDGEGKYSRKGIPFASCRAFYSQGKDTKKDEYLPSIWFKVVAFGKEGEFLDSLPSLTTLANAAKGVRIEVKGRLGQEEWTNNDGEMRSTLVIYATEVKATAGSGAATEEEPQP